MTRSTQEKPLSARVALTCCGTATLRQPDQLQLVFDPPLLRAMAKALALLGALNEIGAHLTLPLVNAQAFSAGGRPWTASSGDHGRFVVSSTWMHVEPERLHIEVWESHGDDELHGFVEFAQHPAVRQAAEPYLRCAEEDLLQGLCAAGGGTRATVPALARALRLAEPWLVKLGDHIGNGTPENPMGRCTALLALRRALARTSAPEETAGSDGAGHPAASGAH